LLFETMVFEPDGNSVIFGRSTSHRDALRIHKLAVDKIKAKAKGDRKQ